jgi:hypothetical protein
MVWTFAQPPRFVDERKVVHTIKSIAEKRLIDLASEKRFIEPAQAVLDELAQLAPAADLVKVDCRHAPVDVRAALFQTAAIELLQAKCRNRYWLWYLLSKLETSTFPVDAFAVARAHARAKAALYDNRFGFGFVAPISLIWELKGMPPGFVLELWDSGRILADPKHDSNGFSLMLNPLLIDD